MEEKEVDINFRKSIVLRASLGFAIGMLMGTGIFVLAAVLQGQQPVISACEPELAERFGSDLGAFLALTLLSGVFGAIANGSSTVYAIESWSILKATVVHFLICICGFYGFGLLLNWVSFEAPLVWIIPTAFVAAYAIVWLSQFLAAKRNVADMNRKLYRWKEKTDTNIQ